MSQSQETLAREVIARAITDTKCILFQLEQAAKMTGSARANRVALAHRASDRIFFQNIQAICNAAK